MKFSNIFPHLRPWVLNLVNVWPAYYVKPDFAAWEVLHILALVVLGGGAIVIGLRLAGAGLREERPSDLYRSLAPYLAAGIVGILATGVLIGMANAERLYDSSAFLVKMIALAAGIVLTYGAVRPIALADGRVGASALAWTLIALLIWSSGLFVFLTGGLITPGLLHVVTAAALIVLALLRGRARWVYVGGLVLILAGMYLATHVFIPPDDLKRADSANLALAFVLAAWVFGAGAAQAFLARRREPAAPKIVGWASILIWVSAAAAGRWIAFA